MSAVAEAPNEAQPVTELKPPREKKKANGGDAHKPVQSSEAPAFTGLIKQIDELKVDLTTMKKEKADARELAEQIKEALMDRSMKEEQKKQLGKAIDGVQERIDRLTSELIALEMGYHQPRLPFGETAEKKKADKPEADAWRKFSLIELFAEMGLSPKLLDKICAAEIKGKSGITSIANLGEFVDFQKQHDLGDIKGIGAAAAKKIEDGLEKWWAAHPEMVPPKDDGPSSTVRTCCMTPANAPHDPACDLAKSNFLAPADLNITAEALDELCQPHLLVNAPYDAHEKIPDLHGCVMYQDKKWVVVAAQVGDGSVYFIRPLLAQGSVKESDKDGKDDIYCGRLVRLGGVVMEMGPQEDERFVKVPADETVPLNEAMGAKPKNKKGRNRRK